MVRLYDLAQAGDHAGAAEQHRLLQPLNRFLEYDPGYVSPAKEALDDDGHLLRAGAAPAARLPRRPSAPRCARRSRRSAPSSAGVPA